MKLSLRSTGRAYRLDRGQKKLENAMKIIASKQLACALIAISGFFASNAQAEQIELVGDIACGLEWTLGRRYALMRDMSNLLLLKQQGRETQDTKSQFEALLKDLNEVTDINCKRNVSGKYLILEKKYYPGRYNAKFQFAKNETRWVAVFP